MGRGILGALNVTVLKTNNLPGSPGGDSWILRKIVDFKCLKMMNKIWLMCQYFCCDLSFTQRMKTLSFNLLLFHNFTLDNFVHILAFLKIIWGPLMIVWGANVSFDPPPRPPTPISTGSGFKPWMRNRKGGM